MEEIWFECDCNYEGFVVMVKAEGMKYKHPVCPKLWKATGMVN